jgi:hypothetical protein
MSRGAHAGHRKPRRRVGTATRTVLAVLGVVVGVAVCAVVGWAVVALTIRVSVLAGIGAFVGVAVIAVLAWLTISRRWTGAASTSRE